jgi:hypothetical protein
LRAVDPSKPIVTIDGIACGPSMAGLGRGNHHVGGRSLIVAYPCDKHEGAHVKSTEQSPLRPPASTS